jgi:Acetyl-CoA hydrolase/transferase C-terminal domain
VIASRPAVCTRVRARAGEDRGESRLRYSPATAPASCDYASPAPHRLLARPRYVTRRRRLTPELNPGAGVVTTRSHAHWVVTEYRAVDPHGRTLRERAALLISVAHPDVRRGELTRAVRATRHFKMP